MKKNFILCTVLAMSIIFSGVAYAGEWKQDEKGWWYQNDDGSYPANQWQEIAGKQYYFGADGYMFANTTTPDGYSVGTDGARTETVEAQVKTSSPLFDFEIDDSRIVYTGYQIKHDYNGDMCLALYYDFTNKRADSQWAGISDYDITLFQNGVECKTTLVLDERDQALDNYSKEVLQGVTINVAQAYKLQDRSDVFIQIRELWNWDNPKKQTATLNIH
ncbi:MAG: DUF5067 domain-containing protein [Lachnospiraceae bacterium]|jgi:hypothetical protein|nr:DUF5067 domain-containing protein [Lachnospiraceae bacterium]MCI9282101.1 DUF5067 domain-containing protein [Lachnospiraceae bacterium]